MRNDIKFYNTSYFGHLTLEELEDDDVIEIRIYMNSEDISEEVKELFININECEYNKYAPIEALIRKRDLDFIKKNIPEDIFIDVPIVTLKLIKPKDGEMFNGWRGKPVKINPEDLPKGFVKIYYYKKAGYVDCRNVKSAKYIKSKINEESIRDDLLLISYKDIDMKDYKGFEEDIDTYFGPDIYIIAKGIKEFSGITEPLEEIHKKLDM